MLHGQQLNRACDNCHSVKEKCRKSGSEPSCERCSRLGQICKTKRTVSKTGRKSKLARRLSYTLPNVAGTNSMSDCNLPRDYELGKWPVDRRLGDNTAIFPDLDNWEKHYVNLMKDSEGPSPLDKFLVGPSFYQSHHISFLQNILQPTSPLKDAAVACAAVFFGEHGAEYSHMSTEIGYHRAARAISYLRNCKISDEQELATVLILGISLTTFAMHVEEGQPSLISRFILKAVDPQYQCLLPSGSATMDFLMCLVCTETFECLLKCHLPAMRINTDGRSGVVDRYVGVSYPIFPLLFDICQLSWLMQGSSDWKSDGLYHQLEQLNIVVEQWKPSPPSDFLQKFTQTEVVIILAQARILQLLGLLILHRLQNPYGIQDTAAFKLSQAIIAEFEMVIKLTGRSVPCTALAYLAACFEINDMQSRGDAISRTPEIITFSRQSQIKFRARLISIWNARDLDHGFYWFDLARFL